MKRFARRVSLVVATATVAMGLVAVSPAPSNALADTGWPCPGCRSAGHTR